MAADFRPMAAADVRGLDSATTAHESVYQNPKDPSDDDIKPVKDEAGPSSSSGQESASTSSSSISAAAEKNGEPEDRPDVQKGESFLSPLALDRKLSRSRDVWKFHLRAADDDEPEYGLSTL